MNFNQTEIEKLSGLLAANVKFKLDCRLYINKNRKLLIVEGATDEAFLKHIQHKCVDSIVAAKVFNSNNQFRTSPSDNINCKSAIVKIITGISHFPSPFIKYAEDIDKWDMYGLVDSDNEEIALVGPTERLFITDTHDLETLLLSTDEELLYRLEQCEISQDDINRAYFISYQLATIRSELKPFYNAFDLKSIACSLNQVDFSSFVDNDRINIPQIVEYISKKTSSKVSDKKMQEIINEICKSKGLKKKIDADNSWKQSLENFSASDIPNFWETVNGHDVLQVLLYYNKSVYDAFGESKRYTLNRSFEMSIIANYDYSQFSKTELHCKMKQAGLIKEE